MITLDQLQKEVRIRTDQDFINSKRHYPTSEMLDWVANLLHAHVRKEREEQIAAIGEIVIALADYCNGEGINLHFAIDGVWRKVREMQS